MYSKKYGLYLANFNHVFEVVQALFFAILL